MTTRMIVYKDRETGERLGVGLLHEWWIFIVLALICVAALVHWSLAILVLVGYGLFLRKRSDLVEFVAREEWESRFKPRTEK